MPGDTSKHTDEKRRETCLVYLLKGNIRQTSKLVGVAERTIADWVRSDWWQDLTEEVRKEKDNEIVAQLDQVLDRSFRETLDRLDNGDKHIVRKKDGYELVSVPIKGKDAAIITSIAIDKRQIMLNKPTSIRSGGESMKALMQEFERLVNKNKEKDVVSVQDGDGNELPAPAAASVEPS